jgi:hypothetical protein
MRTSILIATLALLVAIGAAGAVASQTAAQPEDPITWCNG